MMHFSPCYAVHSVVLMCGFPYVLGSAACHTPIISIFVSLHHVIPVTDSLCKKNNLYGHESNFTWLLVLQWTSGLSLGERSAFLMVTSLMRPTTSVHLLNSSVSFQMCPSFLSFCYESGTSIISPWMAVLLQNPTSMPWPQRSAPSLFEISKLSSTELVQSERKQFSSKKKWFLISWISIPPCWPLKLWRWLQWRLSVLKKKKDFL